MISRYGVDVVIRSFLIMAIVLASAFAITDSSIIRYLVFCVISLVALFVIYFFRDPDRFPPGNDLTVLSPADGKVVQIKKYFEDDYLHQEAVQVSIFMSPLDVHVNRFPITGTIQLFKHIPGKYLVAFNEKSSELNERTHIGIDAGGYKILFKQIAGTIARRIVSDIRTGQKALRGERFGMIKFGSRMDVIMPASTEIVVSLNDRVRAGESIIGRYPEITKGIS